MEIEGKIIMDLPEVGGTSKAGNLWRKKEWVMEMFGNPQFPKRVCFNAFNDRIDSMHLEVGKAYRVSIDIESREYQGRWYTDIRGYAATEITADPMMGGAPAPGYAAPAQPAAPANPAFGTQQMQAPIDPFAASSSDTDDLPF